MFLTTQEFSLPPEEGKVGKGLSSFVLSSAMLGAGLENSE